MLYRKRLAVQGREKNIDKELFDLGISRGALMNREATKKTKNG
jgi:hypothetical protein